MKKHLVIVGGGHAGTSAALAAARQRQSLGKESELKITLVNHCEYLGIRPRYYEYELEETQVSLTQFLSPVCVEVCVASVNTIDWNENVLICDAKGKEKILHFDGMIFAGGSALCHFVSDEDNVLHDIDTYSSACAFRDAFQQSLLSRDAEHPVSIAILGGGITGIELACELPVTANKILTKNNRDSVPLQIYILDKNRTCYNLGENLSDPLQKALAISQVICIDHALVDAVRQGCVSYNHKEQIKADIIVSTLGMQANVMTSQLGGALDRLGRVVVDRFLRAHEDRMLFVAGDAAVSHVDEKHLSVMSCQQARPQGRYAGHNAVSALFGVELLAYSQPNYVTCIDLGEYGAVFTEGWDRQVCLVGADAKQLKKNINQDRIYPPKTTDVNVLLESGKPEYSPPSS